MEMRRGEVFLEKVYENGIAFRSTVSCLVVRTPELYVLSLLAFSLSFYVPLITLMRKHEL